MKLHGARKLGSTSALLNNIDKYVKTLLWQLYAKIEKKLLNSFGANDLQILTFSTLKNDL